MDQRIFRGKLQSRIIEILFVGVLLAVVMNLLYLFVLWRVLYPFYAFAVLFQWPLVLPVGIFCTACFYCLTKTTIRISDGEVCIRRLGKNRVIPITSSFQFETKVKLHIVEIVKYNHFSRILHVIGDDQNHEIFPLSGFSEKEMEGLRAEIYARKLSAVPLEEKIEIVDESWREEMFVEIPKRKMIHKEWKRVGSAFLLLLCFEVVFWLLSFIDTGKGGTLLFLALVVGIVLLVMPFEAIMAGRNVKRCPERIHYMGEHLTVGSKHFTLSGITEVSLTAGDMRSQSMFPVQRYLVIKSVDGKYVYWLGSEKENGYSYESLCNLLKLAFVLCPEKLVFSSKRSLMTK